MENLEKTLWRKVRRYVWFLKFVPFLRMVAVCNNLAFGKLRAESDIDLFIVARAGRLFMVRFLVTVILQVLGVRRHGNKVAGRFCLSFFVDDSALDLAGIAIERDIYLAYWVRSLVPVIDDGVYQEFLTRNLWTLDYFDGDVVFSYPDEKKLIRKSWILRWIFKWLLGGWLGYFFEGRLKKWQMKRAREKAFTAGGKANLIVSDHMLKFHNIDRRRQYRNRWFLKYGEGAKLSMERFLRIGIT